MPTLSIDGQDHEVPGGANVLEACNTLGYDLPYFCWHPALGSIGACRQCAVKVYRDADDTRGHIAMACMTAAVDGLRLSIRDPEATDMRREVVDWLMVNHPHDCPVCDEGGECQLQDMTVMAGHSLRTYRFLKRTFRSQDLGPLVHHEMNRCIQCYRCVRFYAGHADGTDLAAFGAHDHVWFGRHAPGTLESPFSGNLVEVCPTGVFTDKTFRRHFVRKWDLTTAPSICPHCAVGCNTTPGQRTGLLRRIRNRLHEEVNGWFLCDRGRYGYGFVNREDRIRIPTVRGMPVDSHQLTAFLAGLRGREVAGIGSPRASIEGNFALQRLVGRDRFFTGLLARDQGLVDVAVRLLRTARSATLGEIERDVDAVLVLGEDIRNTAPRLELAVRRAARNAPLFRARSRLKLAGWDDQALRDAIQGETGPLFVVGPDVTELDGIATATLRAAPDDVARIGFAVAHALDPSLPEVPLSDDRHALVHRIARALVDAHRPLIVSGTGLGSADVLEAAAAIACALDREGTDSRLSLVTREANSVGLSLLGGRTLEEAASLAEAGGIEVLVVLENDLSRRAPAPFLGQWLDACGTVIVVDVLPTSTTTRADLVLPAGTFAETAGTFVSHEGRAQRFFSAFPPGVVREGWRWIGTLARAWGRDEAWDSLDALHATLTEVRPDLAPIVGAAEPASWRRHRQKAPREPHRYSGRTALHADQTRHEPKPPDDPDSALAFSMEGTRDPLPPSLRSFEWAPGWSSDQAAARLTAEARAAGIHEDAGIRLLEPAPALSPCPEIPPPFVPRTGRILLLEAALVFGTEELSSTAPDLASLIPSPYVELGLTDADLLGLRIGDLVEVVLGNRVLVLPLRVSPGLPRGVGRLPRDLPSLRAAWGFPLPAWVVLRPAGVP